ncbi:MAG: hypothetical protein V4506_09330 [Bacteroidota bacterium]
MKYILLTLSLLSGLWDYGQSLKQTITDKYYNLPAYEKRAPMYAELAGKKDASSENIRKAAQSYSKLNIPQKAETYYQQPSQQTDIQPINYYNYAQTLLNNGKYKQAEDVMRKFYDYSNINTVAKRYYKAGSNYTETIKQDSPKYSIKPLEGVNSSESDFAPAYQSKTELVYTTNKENHGA